VDWILLTIALAGLAFAVLSALERRVAWVAAFCAWFGEGCRETGRFTLFKAPIAWWGAAYYLALAAAVVWARPLVFWLAVIGAGLELTFLWIMASLRVFCIFCLANAAVVAALVAAVWDPARFWQAAAVALAFFLGSHFLLSRENARELTAAGAPKEQKPPARVDGEEITQGQLVRPLTGELHQLRRQIYELKRDRLERLVRERLLEHEARRQGVEPEELRRRALERAEPVDQAEVERYLRRHRGELPDRSGSEETLRDQARRRLEKVRREEALSRFAEELKERHEVEINLPEPAPPQTRVSIEHDPYQGPEDAPVVVVELSDYQCPACRAAHPVSKEVRREYRDRVRWVFKDFPLQMHPQAHLMAQAAHCARDQGAYWKMQDRLFAMQGEPAVDDLREAAEELGLDGGRLAQCLEQGEHQEDVERSLRQAREAGVCATPTYIVGGRLVSGGLSRQELEGLIQEELAKARA
jgi:protein-disulfide isomerase